MGEGGATHTSREEELATARRALAEFLAFASNVRRLSPHTVRNYEIDVEAYLSWCEREGVRALRPTRREMRGYLSGMVRARYANKTINRRLSALRSFFAWLERSGTADASVVFSIPGRKLAKSLPHAITDEEVVRMVATCDSGTDEGLRDRALIELLYASGARISEAAALKPEDIDFKQGQVRLFGKGSKERIVPLYDVALEAIRTYLQEGRPELTRRRKGGRRILHALRALSAEDDTGHSHRHIVRSLDLRILTELVSALSAHAESRSGKRC
jgi:integrase/recombinase XerD